MCTSEYELIARNDGGFILFRSYTGSRFQKMRGILRWGSEFVKLVICSEGQAIFADLGQPPIVPAVGSGAVPGEVRGMVELG